MDTIKLSALVYPYYEYNTEYGAMQDVTWKSGSPQMADFIRDGNGKKASFKQNIVRTIRELSLNLNDSVEVTQYGQIIVRGGTSIDLSKLISCDSDATEKTLYWFEGQGEGEHFASITAKGKLTASKVTSVKDLYFVVSTENDPSYYNDDAVMLLINILIVPH